MTKEQFTKEIAKIVARADRHEQRESRTDGDDAYMFWGGYKAALYDLINTINEGSNPKYCAIVVDSTDWDQMEQIHAYAVSNDCSVEQAVRLLVDKAVAQ